MLDIVVINCDRKYIDYEWKSKEEFVRDMESKNGNIPMFDDFLAEVNTDNNELYDWWRDTDGITVNDLYEECKLMK